MKTTLTTPTPHISKKDAPQIWHEMRVVWRKNPLKGLSQRRWCTNRLLWHTNSDFYGIRTPTFTPYEPLLLGVGVVFQYIEACVRQHCFQSTHSLPRVGNKLVLLAFASCSITISHLRVTRAGVPYLGGSLVGVWNGWGYGIAFFRTLNFQISEPGIWPKSLFLRNFGDFPGKFGL